MRKLILAFLLIAFGLVFSGCPVSDGGDILTFVNQSDQDLFVYTRKHQTEKSLQSDTLLPYNKLGTSVLRYPDKPNGQNVTDLGFEDSTYAISVFVMSLDSIRLHPWNTIRDKYMVLKRYDIRKSEWKTMNGLIYE